MGLGASDLLVGGAWENLVFWLFAPIHIWNLLELLGYHLQLRTQIGKIDVEISSIENESSADNVVPNVVP